MSTDKSAKDVIDEWKETCFFDNLLIFGDAAASLASETDRLVELRVGTGSRASTWTVSTAQAGVWLVGLC